MAAGEAGGVESAHFRQSASLVPATVSYRVVPADLQAHRYEVRCDVADSAGRELVFQLPSWIRGSYLLREFAKHVIHLEACRDGQRVPIQRLNKRRFRVAAAPGAVHLEYAVHAFDESVRKAWLDSRRGFFNGSSLFYCPEGYEQGGFELEIVRPQDPAAAQWKLATTLTALKVDDAGFGRYAAADYEELIDHPVEMADFQAIDFVVDGIPHSMVLSGRCEVDQARLAADLQKICHVEREMFGQQPQLDRFLFLTHVVSAGYGGLEHRSSTALICSRTDLPRPGKSELSREYRQFLGLCSHEYFHLWNVKRITAASFLASDLGAEAYTDDLWHYEGVTSYYDDLFLLRAGIVDAACYLDLLAEQATRLQRSPARQVHTLADASFETWIKYYQPDENSPNASTNYYVKGALAALCLDLKLRLESGATLDDVMSALWRRYGAEGIGVPEHGLEAIAHELSGLRLQPFFDRLLRSTEELPMAELLAEFGITTQLRPAVSPIDDGGRTGGRAQGSWVGLRLRAGETTVSQVLNGSPAELAGLSAGDQLVALDGLKLTGSNWHRRLEALEPACAVRVVFFRGDELMNASLTPVAPPSDTWTFTLAEVSDARAARRLAWLGC